MQKTGATPIPISDSPNRQVKGVIRVETFLVNYVDGFGKESTDIAFKLGNEFRMLNTKSLTPPLQKWLNDKLLEMTKEMK